MHFGEKAQFQRAVSQPRSEKSAILNRIISVGNLIGLVSVRYTQLLCDGIRKEGENHILNVAPPCLDPQNTVFRTDHGKDDQDDNTDQCSRKETYTRSCHRSHHCQHQCQHHHLPDIILHDSNQICDYTKDHDIGPEDFKLLFEGLGTFIEFPGKTPGQKDDETDFEKLNGCQRYHTQSYPAFCSSDLSDDRVRKKRHNTHEDQGDKEESKTQRKKPAVRV